MMEKITTGQRRALQWQWAHANMTEKEIMSCLCPACMKLRKLHRRRKSK